MRLTGFPATFAAAACALTLAAAAPAVAQMNAQGPADTGEEGGTVSPPMGPGMMGGYGDGHMGPGMMQGYGRMGQGMMGGYGYGQMGPGMMQGQGSDMGPGMMRGYGPMGRGMGQYGYVRPPLNLSVADVQGFFANWIARSGNPNLKVGKVTEKDKQTITVDIVTKDNSLVREFEVDRATGYYHPAG